MAQDNSRFTNFPWEKSSSAEQWDNADVRSVCPSVHHAVAARWAAEVVVGDVPVGMSEIAPWTLDFSDVSSFI